MVNHMVNHMVNQFIEQHPTRAQQVSVVAVVLPGPGPANHCAAE